MKTTKYLRIAGFGTEVLNPRPLVYDVEVGLTKYPTATISSDDDDDDDDDKLRTWNCRIMHAAQVEMSVPTARAPWPEGIQQGERNTFAAIKYHLIAL
jgi:hypothetical protein